MPGASGIKWSARSRHISMTNPKSPGHTTPCSLDTLTHRSVPFNAEPMGNRS
jgi:hypothetical protein